MTRFFIPLASVLVFALFALATLFTQPRLAGARLDVTENRLFTLSDGARNVLKGLVEPVDVTLVYAEAAGRQYPAIQGYAERVRELLASYDAVAGGRLRIREIDPEPFSEAEDEALAAGVTALEADGVSSLYFGLIGRNAVDDQVVIPFLAPEREDRLEYDLIRMIARLDDPDPAVVGVVSSLPGMAGDGREGGYFALQEMAKTYRIVELTPDFPELPEDLDVLLLAHAEPLAEPQAYLVDQFILRGGRAMIFVDPAARTATGGLPGFGGPPVRSGLGPFSQAWGVSLSRDVVADAGSALAVNITDEAGRRSLVGQPLFIAAPPERMNTGDLATAALGRPVHFGAAGALTFSGGPGAAFVPLITTGEAPSYFDPDRAMANARPQEVVEAYDALDAPLVLAGRLTGTLPTAFPGGAPSADVSPNQPHLETSAAPADIVLVADADVLDDGFYIDPGAPGLALADNATFILNALDTLAGGDGLVGLRSRSANPRPMTRVIALREAAEARFFNEQTLLEERLEAARIRLEELQTQGAGGGFFAGDLDADLSDAERSELAAVRQDIVEARARLREIERDFRRDIDSLEAVLRGINIWAAPVLVALVGWLVMWRRRQG